jgi:hypothetical protein
LNGNACFVRASGQEALDVGKSAPGERRKESTKGKRLKARPKSAKRF